VEERERRNDSVIKGQKCQRYAKGHKYLTTVRKLNTKHTTKDINHDLHPFIIYLIFSSAIRPHITQYLSREVAAHLFARPQL
jgi:hypothetical protein